MRRESEFCMRNLDLMAFSSFTIITHKKKHQSKWIYCFFFVQFYLSNKNVAYIESNINKNRNVKTRSKVKGNKTISFPKQLFQCLQNFSLFLYSMQLLCLDLTAFELVLFSYSSLNTSFRERSVTFHTSSKQNKYIKR